MSFLTLFTLIRIMTLQIINKYLKRKSLTPGCQPYFSGEKLTQKSCLLFIAVISDESAIIPALKGFICILFVFLSLAASYHV